MSWKFMSLDSICDFQSGLWTGKKPPFVNIKVIRNTNFTKDCQLKINDIVHLDVEESQFSKRELKYGDLILEKSGGGPKQAVGRVVKFDITDNGYSVSNFTSIIRIKNKEIIDFQYLQKFLYFFYVSGQTLSLQNNSTGIRNLNNKAYQKIEIPVPPLSEQQQIVEKLDTAFELIDRAKANIEKNIQNAKELFQSKLNQVFSEKGEGWEEKKLKDLGKVQTGTTPPTKDIDNYGNFIPFVKPAHFNKNGEIFTSDSYLSAKGISKSRLINANSILMVCIGATIGKTGFTNIDVTCNQQINTLTPNKEYNHKFLYFGMISRVFQDKVLREGK